MPQAGRLKEKAPSRSHRPWTPDIFPQHIDLHDVQLPRGPVVSSVGLAYNHATSAGERHDARDERADSGMYYNSAGGDDTVEGSFAGSSTLDTRYIPATY